MGAATFLSPTLTITDDRHPPSPSPSFLLWIANLLLSIVKFGSFSAIHSEKYSLLGESGSGSGGFLAAEWERRLSSRRLLRTRATRTSSNSGRTGLPSKPKQHDQQCLRAILVGVRVATKWHKPRFRHSGPILQIRYQPDDCVSYLRDRSRFDGCKRLDAVEVLQVRFQIVLQCHAAIRVPPILCNLPKDMEQFYLPQQLGRCDRDRQYQWT